MAVCVSALLLCATTGAGDDYVKDAFEKLSKMEGQHVRIVFKSMDGKERVAHVKVSAYKATGRKEIKILFNYWDLPDSDRPLVQDYLEAKLGRKLDRAKDQKLLRDTHMTPQWLEPTGSHAIRPFGSGVGVGPYVVLSIEPFEFKAPAIRLKTELKRTEFTDGFASDKSGEPARWGVSYGLPDDSKRFFFRPKNGFSPIVDVIIGKPYWHLSGERWMPALEVICREAKGRTTSSLLFLDRRGHVRGSLRGDMIPTAEYLKHLEKTLVGS